MRHITKLLAVLLVLVGLVACKTPLETRLFRAEQTAANVGHAAYVGWTNYTAHFPVSEQASNEVKRARIGLGSTLLTFDSLRRSYETNKTLKPTLEAMMDSIGDNTSNMLYTVNYWKGQP